MELKEISPRVKSILSDWAISCDVENILIFYYNINEYQFNIMLNPWDKNTIQISVGCFLNSFVYSTFNTEVSNYDELEKYLKKLVNTINDDLTDKLNTELKITFNNTFRSRVHG